MKCSFANAKPVNLRKIDYWARVGQCEIKGAARGKFSSIHKLTNETLENLESMWFKPSHTISLVHEISNITMQKTIPHLASQPSGGFFLTKNLRNLNHHFVNIFI